MFLTKVICVEFPPDAAVWQRICTYRSLRNVIVHNASRLTQRHADYKSLKKYIDTNAHLAVSDRGDITISFPFLEQVLDDLDLFFGGFFDRLKEWAHEELKGSA